MPVFDLKGQPWPLVQPPTGGPADVKRIVDTYGKTAAQEKNLLLDYLFAAGAKPVVVTDTDQKVLTVENPDAKLERIKPFRTDHLASVGSNDVGHVGHGGVQLGIFYVATGTGLLSL